MKYTEVIRKEMNELAPKIMAFFNECEVNPMAKECCDELYKIIGLLKVRVFKGENIFIPRYKDIMGIVGSEDKA